MAIAIESSSEDAGNMLFIGNRSKQLTNQIQESVNRFLESASGNAQDLKDFVKNSFNDLNFGDTFKRLLQLKGLQDFHAGSDEISRIGTIQDLEIAGNRMQRYIMANTGLRELYLKDEVQGYGDAYIPIQENGLGVDFYDYRRVTDGIVMKQTVKSSDKDGKDLDRLVATSFFEEKLDDDQELSVYEQFKIMTTWDTIDAILAEDNFTDFTAIPDLDNDFEEFLA